jgi:hypothetical protein
MAANLEGLPETAVGLRLCKIKSNDELVLCEPVQFVGGYDAVHTVLRRAAISGTVGPVGEAGDYFADIMDENGDMIETIALSRNSWNSLKNHWMRCRIDPLNERIKEHLAR